MLIRTRLGRSLLIIFVISVTVACSPVDETIGNPSTPTPASVIEGGNSIPSTVIESDSADKSELITESGDQNGIDAIPENSRSDVALVVLVLVLLVSTALNLFVIRWLWWGRKFHTHPSEVPELLLGEVKNHNNDLRANFQSLSGDIETATKIQLEIAESANDTTENLASSFQVLRSALDDRDEEIKRLKEGYDLAIFRRFVIRFVRLDLALIDELANTGDAGQLSDFRDLLLDALDECGVTPFFPEVGAEYRSSDGVEDDPVFEPTDDIRQDGKISRVVRSGYLLENSETSEVVIPAKVAVFKQQKLEA